MGILTQFSDKNHNKSRRNFFENRNMMAKAEQDKEIHILQEDQQKINQFARLNNRLEEYKGDIKAKKNEIQTLEDASTDLMMLADEEKVPYQIGEVFVEMTQDEVQETMEAKKRKNQRRSYST